MDGPNNREILRLLAGYRKFRERFFEKESSVFQKLSVRQSPKTLIIGCCDSRVDPAILSSAAPGELFVVRNVANLVPPFESDQGFHGVSASIEFAVESLQVENVVILGHRQCGGIRSLFYPESAKDSRFVSQWMSIAAEARDQVKTRLPSADADIWCRECEKESIVISLRNLRTFPFVAEAVRSRGLNLLGLYFDLESGQLLQCEEATGEFSEVSI